MDNLSSPALPPVALRVFETLPQRCLVLSPQLTILTASNAYLHDSGRSRKEIAGLNISAVINDSALIFTLQRALQSKQRLTYRRYRLEPVLTEQEEVSYLILEIAGIDLNPQMEMLFHSIPAQIAIVSGPELIYTYINPQYQQELFPGREVLGLPLLEALPEIKNEPILEILRNVYVTGEPYIDSEIRVPLADVTGGPLRDHYFNVVYQPLRDAEGKVEAILSFKYEITEHVAARKHLEINEEELQAANEELMAGNEEMAATNEELKQAQDELSLLNENLEERIRVRTAELADSEQQQQSLNEELTASNEELSGTITQLAISEQKVRSVVESAPFPIGVYSGREMRIELLNQAIIDTWKRGADLIGKTYAEVLPELAGTGVYERLDEVFTTGIPYHAEHQRVDLTVDGILQPFYFNYDFTPLLDANGWVYGVMNTAADVTDLVTAKLQVEQSQKSLYNIIMRSPVAKSILLGPDHVIDVANDKVIELWGKSREAVMNKPIFSALPEATGQGFEALMEEVYTQGNTIEANERPLSLLRNGHMETLYLNFVYQPYRDAHEHILGVILTAIDVTAQVFAREEVQQLNEELAATNEELHSANEIQAAVNENLADLNRALQLSQDELQLAIDAAGLATWDYNPATGRFVGNDLTKAWFGLLPEDEIELGLAIAAIADEDRERVTAAIVRAMTFESGGDYDIFYTIVHPQDFTRKVVRAKGKALFNEQREATRLAGVLQDVTEQKKDEQRKNDFIGMASHELKTPLTSLKALIQVSSRKLAESKDPFLRTAIDKSAVQVKRMEAMINGFLNISRLEAGKMAIDKRRFDLQKLITTVVREVELTTGSHRIDFVVCDTVWVNADEDKIESVIANLISNAAKYSAKGTRISVLCERTDDRVKVSVADEGTGIAPEDQARIFERYYRVDGIHNQHISGFGIGLYLCAEIIQRHGGRIGVISESGKGSTFYFELPVA